MSIRHGVYIQEEATAVQVPKTGNSSVQVVVGTAPVNMAENPSEAVNVPILANSGTEAMAALGYSVDFKNFTLCQTMFATSNLFQVSPVVYINVLDPAKHNKELAEAEYQVNQKQAVIEKEGIILEGLTVKNSTGDTELKAGEDYSAAFDSTTGFLTITMLAGGKGAAATAIKVSGKVIDPSKALSQRNADIVQRLDFLACNTQYTLSAEAACLLHFIYITHAYSTFGNNYNTVDYQVFCSLELHLLIFLVSFRVCRLDKLNVKHGFFRDINMSRHNIGNCYLLSSGLLLFFLQRKSFLKSQLRRICLLSRHFFFCKRVVLFIHIYIAA